MKGSIGAAPYPLYTIPGVVDAYTCLLPMVNARSGYLLRLYSHYKNGNLLAEGGIIDQPQFYSDAMALIEEQAKDGSK